MAKTRDYLDYLDEKVEIAPANSQEEYQAAQTIAELMSDHGLDPSIEEFEAYPMGGIMSHVLTIVLLVCLVICGITHDAIHWVFLLLAIAAAGLYLYTHYMKNVFEHFGPTAKSQNVVAVHRADSEKAIKGARPIVIVAHYDTPREGLLWKEPLARYQATLRRISVICILAVSVTLLVQLMAFLPEAVRLMFWIIGIIACLPPVVLAVLTMLEQRGSCTLGSNNNKASMAAMLSILDKVRPADDRATAGDRPRKAQRRAGDTPKDEPPAPRVREVVEEVHGVRHGRDLLMQLGVLPPSCEVVYEEPKVRIVEEAPEPEAEPLPTDEEATQEESAFEDQFDDQAAWEEDYDSHEWDDSEDQPQEDKENADALDADVDEQSLATEQEQDVRPDLDIEYDSATGTETDADVEPIEPIDEGDQPTDDVSTPDAGEYEDEHEDDLGVEDADNTDDVADDGDDTYDTYAADEDDDFADDYVEGDYGEEDFDEDFDEFGEDAPASSIGTWFSNRLDSIKSFFASRKKRDDVLIERGENQLEDEGYLEDESDEYWADGEYDGDDAGLMDELTDDDEEDSSKGAWRNGIPSIGDDHVDGPGEELDESEREAYDADYGEGAEEHLSTTISHNVGARATSAPTKPQTPQQMAEQYIDLSSIDGEIISYEEYEEIVYVDEEEDVYEDEIEIVYEDEEEDAREDVEEEAPEYDEYGEYDESVATSEDPYVAAPADDYADEYESNTDAYEDEQYEYADEQRDDAYDEAYDDGYDDDGYDDDGYDDGDEYEYVEIAYQDGVDEPEDTREAAEEDLYEEDAYEEEVLDEEEPYLPDPYEVAESAVAPSLGQRIRGVFKKRHARRAEQSFIQDQQAWDEGVLDEDGYGPRDEYVEDDYLEDDQYAGEESFEEDVEYVEYEDDEYDEDPYDEDDEYDEGPYDDDDEYDEYDEEDVVYEQDERRYQPPVDPNLLHFDREQDSDVIPKDTTGLDTIIDSYDVLEYRDEQEVREAPEPVNDPTWGTTSYQPARPIINIARRAALFDLPDPSAAGIDSFDSLDDDYDYDDETKEAEAAKEVPHTPRSESGDQASFWGDSDASRSSWKGGAAVRSDLRDSDEPLVIDEEDLQDAILEFGDEFLQGHDIWFVATGASSLNHAGIKDFVERHKRDVRGSFLINLEAVGAGELAIFTKEGMSAARNADRRLVRMLTDIARDLHVNLDSMPFDWGETDSATTMRARLRSITLAGVDDNNLLAYAHTPEDTPENVNPSQVSAVVRIVTELIRRS